MLKFCGFLRLQLSLQHRLYHQPTLCRTYILLRRHLAATLLASCAKSSTLFPACGLHLLFAFDSRWGWNSESSLPADCPIFHTSLLTDPRGLS